MAAKTAGTWVVQDPIGIQADLAQVDTAAQYPLGKRITAYDNGATGYGFGEFIYLAGVTSCARGSVCLVTDDWGTALIQARDKGAVAIALGAVDASTKFGWFQIWGKAVAACDTVADGAPCYIDGTAGRVDDAAVAGDCILGMRTSSADDTSTCVVTMATYPSVGDFDNA
jgi:hypothetical protein